MTDAIDDLLKMAQEETGKKDSYPFLPEIIRSLEVIRDDPGAAQEERVRRARGLGRLVTESFDFSESPLGTSILLFLEGYV